MPTSLNLPKGDSAWLLRKAIQRITQQVSVLETNIGSSTTGNSSNGQLIFNDDGVLRGDPDIVFNKAQDRLIITSLEVSTTATITGNTTVATDAFAVRASDKKVFVGTAPISTAYKFFVTLGGTAGSIAQFTDGIAQTFTIDSTAGGLIVGNANNGYLAFYINGTERARIDSSGNVGIGNTPTAGWRAGARALQLGAAKFVSIWEQTNGSSNIGFACYESGSNALSYTTTGDAPTLYSQISGRHQWYNAPSGTAGNAITFTQAMTLDASGNLLVGITSGSFNRIKKDVVADAGNAIFELVGASNATSSIHYSVSSYNANAANAASKFGRDGVTLRSINAGGTINASGADYAEYMTKCSGFVLSKGSIAGVDANGKLTNVFADAISFVVKSTDPSYVGNDKWGTDLEGDALESARQLVDRIAFAGQVPVNVIGAKAGDYIVPVVDGTGIKGIAVSKPTFEQYQIAVGKVIAIDADGRARIIVKVA